MTSAASTSEDPDAFAAAVVAGAGDAIMAMDLDGRVVVWNAGCEALFGWTAQEMAGATVDQLFPEERRDEVVRLLGALDGATEPAALETERRHKSGHTLPVACRVSPVRAADGRVVGSCAVVRDNSREIELRRDLDQARRVAEARFAQSVVPQATLTPAGVLVDVNPALCRLSGYDVKELLGRPASELVADADSVDSTVARRWAAVARGEDAVQRLECLLHHADGRLVETRVSVFPLRDEGTGEVLRLEVVVEDVSAAAAAERELATREARWQSMAEHSSDVGLFCAADAQLLYVTCSVTSIFGYHPESLVGGDGWSFVHPDDVAAARAVWDAVAAEPGASRTVEARLRHADGSWRWVEESLTNHLADTAVAAIVVNLVDVTERKTAEAVLDELVGTDTLTGLATRAPLMAALDAAFAGERGATTAVVLVDVSRMKLVNDRHGHRAGDEVLRQVATRLRAAAPSYAVVARLGGDRFAVLLQGVEDIADAFEAAAAFLAAVEAPLELDGMTLSLTASVGAALGPAVESGALLAAAESALGTAKDGLAGPMHVVRAESATAGVFRARLVEDLRRGLREDELVVHYQPVISIPDGRAVAAEALVRWAHPEKGLLGPGAFIDAAEESGLIVELGQKVLRDACAAAARWAAAGHGPFHVAVNLSARQLTRSGVVDVVREALAESGAAPASLMLEVTESAVMSDVDAAVSTLQELRELGVAIAVDDFGTGYASLTYLKRFPVTALKIDRSFVSGLGSNSDDAAIVTSVINLARAMQLDCIAEGVETEQQRLVLQALGCAFGQGFLWSPALDVADFEPWLGMAASAAGAARPGTAARLSSSPSAAAERIAALKAEGASLATIAAALNAEQQLTAQGRRWTARSVAHLLASRPLR